MLPAIKAAKATVMIGCSLYIYKPSNVTLRFVLSQALLRRLLAEHSLHSWGRAELALSLLQEGEGRFSLQDVVEAVRESQDRDFIKRMLTQECAVCGWELPRNKVSSFFSWLQLTLAIDIRFCLV